MKIHDSDGASYLQSLARALARDPQSHSAWSCLHLKAPANQPFTASRIASISAGQHGIDSAAVITPNRDLLLFSRERDLGTFQAFSLQLGSTRDDMIAIYNLFHDYKPVLAMLDAMTVGTPESSIITLPEGVFGETAALSDVFQTVKQRRRARSPLHVLVVEDDVVTRRVVSGLFKNDYALITAQNAHEAVADYMLYAPDIVFLDIGLPDRSGMDVLQEIVACDSDAYVVMVSSSSHLDTMISAINAGAAGFIAKPFQRDRMRSYISESAAHHRKAIA